MPIASNAMPVARSARPAQVSGAKNIMAAPIAASEMDIGRRDPHGFVLLVESHDALERVGQAFAPLFVTHQVHGLAAMRSEEGTPGLTQPAGQLPWTRWQAGQVPVVVSR